MRLLMLDRETGLFNGFQCKIKNTGDKRYAVWGRFRIRVNGKPKHVFGDMYDLSEADASFRSRNNITLYCGGDKVCKDVLIAVHLVLPDSFKGKCIKAVNGRRIFYDYRKKSDSPSGHFSVMALVLIQENETVTLFDTDKDLFLHKHTVGNIDGKAQSLIKEIIQ